jgi:hypothetical protein
MRVNIKWRSGDRAGRARLSETAGSAANHRPVRPSAFASSNGSRPNRMQLRPRSGGHGETPPTCALARLLPKSCAPSASDSIVLTQMVSCRTPTEDNAEQRRKAKERYHSITALVFWPISRFGWRSPQAEASSPSRSSSNRDNLPRLGEKA